MRVRGWMIVVVPILVFIAAILPVIVHSIKGLAGNVDNLKTIKSGPNRLEAFKMPGSATVTLKRGGQKIFYEYKSSFEGASFSTPETAPNIRMKVVGPNGKDVTLNNPKYNQNFSGLGGRSGHLAFKFNAPTAGKYTIIGIAENPADTTPRIFSVGKGLFDFKFHVPKWTTSLALFSVPLTLVSFVLLLLLWNVGRKKKPPHDPLHQSNPLEASTEESPTYSSPIS